MPTVDKKRIEFIDLAKGVCIFLVVVVHAMPEFNERFEFLACLRMPLYFCLSGLFYKDYGSFKNFSIKKTNKILIPFVAWYLISYSIYYIGRWMLPSGNEATFHIYDVFLKNDIFNIPIWFLLCLFWSNLIFSIITRITKQWWSQLAGVVICAGIGLFMISEGIRNVLYIGSSFTCMPFFYLGYALKKTTLLYPDTNKRLDFLIMVSCLAIASIMAFIPERPPHFDYFRNLVMQGEIWQIYICAILFVIGVLLICKFIKRIPFISWLGRYSIIVLVTHFLLMDLISKGISKFTSDSIAGTVKETIVLFSVLALMGVVIPLVKKFMPHISAQKDVLKAQHFENSFYKNLKNKIMSKYRQCFLIPLFSGLFLFSMMMSGCNSDEPQSENSNHPETEVPAQPEDDNYNNPEDEDVYNDVTIPSEILEFNEEGISEIVRKEIHDNINGLDRPYSVLLPSSYFNDSSKTYPVIYLLHGHGASYSIWISLKVKSFYDYYVSNGLLKEMIIVMPDAEVSYYVDGYQAGINYESFFFNEFLPMVEQEFRIDSRREKRFIAGMSMGGYGASYYAFKYSEMFNYCYAMSAVFEGKGTLTTPPIIDVIKDNGSNDLPFITLDTGYDDPFFSQLKTFHHQLQEMRIPHECIERVGAHNNDFWKGSVYLLFERLSKRL